MALVLFPDQRFRSPTTVKAANYDCSFCGESFTGVERTCGFFDLMIEGTNMHARWCPSCVRVVFDLLQELGAVRHMPVPRSK